MRLRRKTEEDRQASTQCYFCGVETEEGADNVYLFLIEHGEHKRGHAHTCHRHCAEEARAASVPPWPEQMD